MGLIDKLFSKEEGEKETPTTQEREEKEIPAPKEKAESQEICTACNEPGADKHFAGQAWHKKCLRKARKMAKSML